MVKHNRYINTKYNFAPRQLIFHTQINKRFRVNICYVVHIWERLYYQSMLSSSSAAHTCVSLNRA